MLRNFRKLALLTLGLFLIGVPVVVFAGSDQFKDNVYIAADEVVDGNIIKAANIIDIKGAVNGDVIVAGNSVTITGPVAGDVIAAGSTVRILGTVGGSIRVVGSVVEIGGEVERNVWAAGGSVLINEDAKVGWDVYSAGATVELKAPIGGNVWLTGASIILDNTIGKSAKIAIDEGGQVVLNPEAKISDDLSYDAASEDQLVIREGATVGGETTLTKVNLGSSFDADKAFGAAYLFFKTIVLFSLLIVGLVFVTLVPKIVIRFNDEMVKRPWPSIGWGLVYLLLTPIIAVLLMITIIGIPLGLIILPFYVVGLYFAKVFAGFAVGLWVLNKFNGEKKYKGSLVWPLVLGLIIFVALTSIPVIGFIVKMILVLWALGAMITVKRELWREYR